MVPKSNVEYFLQAIIENSDTPFEAKSRIERYITDILEERVSTLEPVFRIEYYLAKISGADVELPKPISRADLYLAALAGEEVTLPDTPNSSLEEYLARWCETWNAVLTITGNPVRFIGMKNTQIQALSVNIRPIQDLHGYPNICPITGRTGVDAFVAPNASMWSKYKLYVDTGAASELMPVGGQITDTWNNTSGTSISFPWDIVHYTSNGDAFLKWHYAAPEALRFDAPEAIYYFDGTEPAGTYHIPIGSSYGTGWVAGHSIQFTLTAAPDEGDQLFISCKTNFDNDPADGREWRVYDAGGKTVKQSGTTSEGTGGTSLGTIGNVNAHRTNGRLNAISRVVYGYGRWSQSAMRQYFNSAEVSWWTMKNPWDRPPAQASTIRGFLCGFSQDFLDHLEETEVVTALNTQEGFSETTETTLDKIFLPSLEQMYIDPQLAGVEGESWDYYKALAEEAGLPGKFQQEQTYPILRTYHADKTSSAAYVFLRSCNRGWASSEGLVHNSGMVNFASAASAIRGCPACKFKKSVPNGTRYNVDWTSAAGTVYGGTLDVVTGVLTVTMANIASYNGETINEPWLSSMDAYAAGATPTTGAQVVYTLATPQTYQLTPQEVESLLGINNIWSDSGDVKVVLKKNAETYEEVANG